MRALVALAGACTPERGHREEKAGASRYGADSARQALGDDSDDDDDDGRDPFHHIEVADSCPAFACLDAGQHRLDDAGASLIARGGHFLRDLLALGDEAEVVTRANEDVAAGKVTANLIDMMWFLQACAVENRQGFDEGAFLLVDRDGLLTAYLTAAGSRPRASSHLRWIDAPAYGIDLIPPAGAPGAPNHKRHLLFTPLSADAASAEQPARPRRIFLKPENFGLGWRDLSHHTFEFLVAQARKLGVPGCGRDEGPGMRKERLPKDIRQAICVIDEAMARACRAPETAAKDSGHPVGPSPRDDAALAHFRRTIHTIGEMAAWCRAEKEGRRAGCEPELAAAVERFTAELERRRMDALDLRIGNEVVLELDMEAVEQWLGELVGEVVRRPEGP